jgi:hypothetical protein
LLLKCVNQLVVCCWNVSACWLSVVEMSLPVGGLLLKCLGLLVVCCWNISACWLSVVEMSWPVGCLLLKCLGLLVVCRWSVSASWWSDAEMSRPIGGLLLKCLGLLVVWEGTPYRTVGCYPLSRKQPAYVCVAVWTCLSPRQWYRKPGYRAVV